MKEDKPKKSTNWKEVLKYSSIGIEMVLCVVIGISGGGWLDKKFRTEPILSILGLIIGILAAGKAIWRVTKEATEEKK